MATSKLASFRIGQKELFLPSATLTLLRTRTLGANFAKFRVPLHFSKLDLRDYLWHAYGIEILSVRSYVKLSPVRAGNPRHERPAARRWFRPQSRKFMTVELARPFVWPEEPENFKEWNMDEVKASDVDQEKFSKNFGSLKDTVINDERRERMREQAKALLEGKAQWRPSRQAGSSAVPQERR